MLTALASLSPEHRAVIVLRYLLEYSPGEIARALELPRGTVNSRLRRGLDALEIRLRELETVSAAAKKRLREFRAPDEIGAERPRLERRPRGLPRPAGNRRKTPARGASHSCRRWP